MGPDALMQYMNADEAIKRLAAAQGIDYLNLIKSVEDRDQEQEQQRQQMMQAQLVSQAGQLSHAPMLDPMKNPELEGVTSGVIQQAQQAQQPVPA